MVKSAEGSYFGWYHPDTGVVIVDAKPDNFIMTQVGIEPLDLQMLRFSPQEMRAAGLESPHPESRAAGDAALQSGERTGSNQILPERKPDKNGIHPLSKPQSSRYSSPDDKIRDPASILQNLVRGGDGTNARQPWKHGRQVASHAEVLDWAKRNRKILQPRAFQEALADAPGGGEHKVIFDLDTGRVFKLTKPGLYGYQAEDAGAYLQRWALANRVFGDDVKFEGFVTLPGETEARAVISQPFVKGRDATPEEIRDF